VPIAAPVGRVLLYQKGISRQSIWAAVVQIRTGLVALRMNHAKCALFSLFAAMFAGVAQPQANAQSQAQAVGSASGLPLPRFVSLKADKVNMHAGPGKSYEVKWLYQRAGLPVEITAEFETWRRIRDAEGTEGWVYHSLLSGRRTGMVTAKSGNELVPIYEKLSSESAVVARLERGVIGTVKRCAEGWCAISGRGFDGWIQQTRLWGIYQDERVD
jgi:SH3-like domain-containing protein